jgi:hypothetical protein
VYECDQLRITRTFRPHGLRLAGSVDLSTHGALAAALADARDLPMGRHDQHVMASPAAAAAFAAVVAAERDLRALLRRRLEQDERLLAELNRAAGG